MLLGESKEEGDVLHQLECHLTVVDLRNGARLERVGQLAEQLNLRFGLD